MLMSMDGWSIIGDSEETGVRAGAGRRAVVAVVASWVKLEAMAEVAVRGRREGGGDGG